MKLFADYRQIHVQAVPAVGDLGEAWTARATDDRIAAAGDIVGIVTEAAEDVAVSVEILAKAPRGAAGEHVTEASLISTGVIAVLGCTDYLPDAKTFVTPVGALRVRATHTNLAKRERILIQLWPAKAAKPKVLVRWIPPPPPPPKPIKGAPKTRKQAVALALRGKIELALPKLLALHADGDAAASASAAEILAFLGRTAEMRVCAKALLAKPDAVYAGNVSDDMKALLRPIGKPRKPPKPDRKRYEEAVAESKPSFAAKPREYTQHCFALAVAFHVDDEIIRCWDRKHPYLHFDEAAEVARALVRAKQPAKAWAILESRLSRWYPVDAAQVLPVVLLVDPYLAPLMTPARAQLVMATPRAL